MEDLTAVVAGRGDHPLCGPVVAYRSACPVAKSWLGNLFGLHVTAFRGLDDALLL